MVHRINVHRHIQNHDGSINMVVYYEIIEWLETNLGRAYQKYDELHHGRQIARCGEIWSFHKYPVPSKYDPLCESEYEWQVAMNCDDSRAVAFKLIWS